MESNCNTESIIKFILLSIIDKKGTVASSYFLNQLLPTIGIIESTEQLMRAYKVEGLITDEGYFDDHTGLIKNVSLSQAGKDFLLENRSVITPDVIRQQLGEHDLLNRLFRYPRR